MCPAYYARSVKEWLDEYFMKDGLVAGDTLL